MLREDRTDLSNKVRLQRRLHATNKEASVRASFPALSLYGETVDKIREEKTSYRSPSRNRRPVAL